MIGSIRRECLDHLVVLNERQLRRILSEYTAHFNKMRPHQSLDGNPPEPLESVESNDNSEASYSRLSAVIGSTFVARRAGR